MARYSEKELSNRDLKKLARAVRSGQRQAKRYKRKTGKDPSVIVAGILMTTSTMPIIGGGVCIGGVLCVGVAAHGHKVPVERLVEGFGDQLIQGIIDSLW